MNPEQNLKKKYWSTISEYYQDEEFKKIRQQEFLSKPQSFFEADGNEDLTFSRRDFLRLAGAAAVFAAAGCARRPVEKIVPYLDASEEIIPGKAVWYASTCLGCAAGCGILVKTREGRPIKLEGNPDNPLNQGKLCARGQASLLDLYDPDRLRFPVQVFRSKSDPVKLEWQLADRYISSALKSANGKIVLLTGTIHGLAREKLLNEFLSTFPGARHVTYDAFSEEEITEAQEICYGNKVFPRYRFDRADTVLLLGADPLAGSHSVTEFARHFGLKRKIGNKSMSKVICFEPALSLTGMNADEHYLVRPEDLIKVALALAQQLVVTEKKSEFAGNSVVQKTLSEYAPAKVEGELGLKSGTLEHVASELWKARGRSLVYTGGLAVRDRSHLQLHVVANFLNSILGNDGVTVDASQSPSLQSRGSQSAMLSLISEMQAGKVEVLIIYGTNPAYSLPAATGFAQACQKIKTIVSLNDRIDETGALSDYILPSLHFLESWGDAQPQRGLYSLFQPAISPLHNNRAFEDSLLAFIKEAQGGNLPAAKISWYDYLRDTWEKEIYNKQRPAVSFEEFWVSVLRLGVLDTINRNQRVSPERKFRIQGLTLATSQFKKTESKYVLALYAPAMQFDGRAQNNSWLLETPDPVSKITWDNYLNVAPQTAQELGLSESDVVVLTTDGGSFEIPVHIQPGVHPQVFTVAVGWGREKVGRVGNKVGVNAFKLVRVENKNLIFSSLPVQIQKTSKKIPLACVQGHQRIDGRPIIYEATLEEYRKNPTAGRAGEEKLTSIWPGYPYEGHKWGMAIDLNSCIGCNACVLACQSENNIPVVGKDQVLRGREMAWVRVDRYYSGDPQHPEVVTQPMLCQHCENAPCETVCPVIATLHNEEGLNVQIYNRCVGTRYCSNNCPYKVRRFNWYENNQNLPAPMDLVLNPDVTVREKGVMEKCTFCIQRIRAAKEDAKQQGRKVADGEILTACQQTCPAEAIVFGDLNDPDSKVSKLSQDPRAYHVLEILNTRPSIAYLTKIRNKKKSESHA